MSLKLHHPHPGSAVAQVPNVLLRFVETLISPTVVEEVVLKGQELPVESVLRPVEEAIMIVQAPPAGEMGTLTAESLEAPQVEEETSALATLTLPIEARTTGTTEVLTHVIHSAVVHVQWTGQALTETENLPVWTHEEGLPPGEGEAAAL